MRLRTGTQMENVLSHKISKQSIQTVSSIIIILLTYGAEEILRKEFFRCPCTQYSMYGLAMLLCPSLVLLGLGLMTSIGFWRTALTLNKIRNPGGRCNHCMKNLSSLFRPFLPATAFIVFALMKGDYYICVRAGPSGCQSDEVSGNVAQNTRESLLRMHVQSQILGFGVLVGAAVFALGIVSVQRCFFNDDHLPGQYDLADMEREVLYKAFEDKLQEIVKEEVAKNIDSAFKYHKEGDLMGTFFCAKEKLADIKQTGESMQFISGTTRLSQMRLELDNEEAELRVIDSSTI